MSGECEAHESTGHGRDGFLGRRLAAALVEHGHQVRVLVRNPGADNSAIVNGTEVWRGDLRDPATVIAACEGMEVVQHAGALSSPWGPKSEFYATNVGGTQAVIDGCQRHGVRRLIYVSSPSVVFDGQDQHNLTEAAPYPATSVSVYSHTKKLGEDLVNAAQAVWKRSSCDPRRSSAPATARFCRACSPPRALADFP